MALANQALSGEEALALSENASESLSGQAGDNGLVINNGDATTD